jgi:type IV pilus assembly protein PilM
MADFLSKLSSMSGLFQQKKSESVIGIDVGSSSVKVVQLAKKSGKAVLETYGEIALGPYGGTDVGRSTILTAEKISEAVADLLRESNTTTKNSALSIPISSTFIIFMRIPTTDEKKFAEMVPLEARKYIPVPVSEVSIDWWPVPKDESTISEFQGGQKTVEETGTEILVVVIHNDALSRNKAIQNLSSLQVSFSEVEIFSSLRASLDPSLVPQMLMDFGASSTKVFIIEGGVLKASHVINRGSQDITLSISKSMNTSFDDAEKIKRNYGIVESAENKTVSDLTSVTIDYVMAETERFVLGYYKKYGKKLNKVVLTGGGSLLKGLKERTQKSFEVPIEISDPFAKVEYPAFLEEVLKTAGPVFSVAIGLAIRKLQEM